MREIKHGELRPENETDTLIRSWDDSDWRKGNIHREEYETIEGETYVIAQDQDGDEWIE